MANPLAKIFTWWNGATIGTTWTIFKRGKKVGQDEFGNTYYQARDNRDSYDGRKRRWVKYNGYAEPSKIPPDWHAWMHYITDVPPSQEPLARKVWEEGHMPNFTGSVHAYKPKGAIGAADRTPEPGTGYQRWVP